MVDSVRENFFFARKSHRPNKRYGQTSLIDLAPRVIKTSISTVEFVRYDLVRFESSFSRFADSKGDLKGPNHLLNRSWIQRWIQLESPYLTVPIFQQPHPDPAESKVGGQVSRLSCIPVVINPHSSSRMTFPHINSPGLRCQRRRHSMLCIFHYVMTCSLLLVSGCTRER